MTTIAWDGKTLAADRQRSIGNIPVPATKIFRAIHRREPNMLLYGCAGDSNECVAFKEWVTGNGDVPSIKSLSVLAVDDRKRIWVANDSLVWLPVEKPVFAIGSGQDFAIGAMVAGKTAAEAIDIASDWDVHTGMGVDVLELP